MSAASLVWTAALLAVAFTAGAETEPASVRFLPGQTEVVIAPDAPKTVRFAACEATNFFTRILGVPVPVVAEPTPGKTSLVLGKEAVGAVGSGDMDGLPRDGFAIEAKGNCVFIVGRDDPTADPFRVLETGNIWLLRFERATLFGVYEFFERYAGCRFFFPGEIGTILPAASEVCVPEGRLVRAPDFTSRNPYMGGNGLWYEGTHASPRAACPGKVLHWFRLRCETENAPCCHGSREFHYIERFAKTHPDCLARKKDGSRWDNPNVFAAYQLCWSDPFLRETMYEDVKAYLTGQPASVRGLARWGVNCVGRKYVDIMPEDSFQGCWCAACQAAYDKSKRHYANRLMWSFTADLAKRLKTEGVAGTVTQMSYLPYGEVPDVDLPDNVLVIVAQTGPWSAGNAERLAAETALFKAWKEKTHWRVQTWTYPHKHNATAIPGVPHVAPRAFGKYWQQVAPYVCGGFLESESERAILGYLNDYVFSKIAWDPSVDVEVLLKDHNVKMFGAGADEMDAFFRTLEDKWIQEVAGNIVTTALGPVARVPGAPDLWRRVYSREVLQKLAAHCEAAEQAVGAGTGEAKRVAFIRRQFLRPLAVEAKKYRDLFSVEREQARRQAAGAVTNLVPEADFTTDNGRGGYQAWSALKPDPTTFVSVPYAGKLTHTNRLYAIRYFRDGELKPETRYRISYFLKLQDVKKHGKPDTGVHLAFFDGMTETRFPSGSALDGTVDWIHQAFEVKTGKDVEKLKKGLVCLRLMDASGTVWLDDVRVEELP